MITIVLGDLCAFKEVGVLPFQDVPVGLMIAQVQIIAL